MKTSSDRDPTHPIVEQAVEQAVGQAVGQAVEQAVEQAVGRLAATQGGVIGHRQAVDLGMRPRTIARRVQSGRWVAVFPKVYAIGHAQLRREAWWRAGVLAGGPGAVLSHRSAAALWGLRAWEGKIEVTTTSGGGRARIDGIRRYRTRRLAPADVVVCNGIAVTAPGRTIVDLAEVTSQRGVERAVDEAERGEIAATIVPIAGRRGVRKVLALGAHAPGSTWTRSGHEEAMLALCRSALLHVPAINAFVLGWECDFVWFGERVIVEVDGLDTHRTRGDVERDRRKDLALRLGGFHVLRLVRSQIDQRVDVLRVLAQHGIWPDVGVAPE